MESLLLLAFSLIALGISITGIIIDRPVLQKNGAVLRHSGFTCDNF